MAPSIQRQEKKLRRNRAYIKVIVWVLTPLTALTAVMVFFNASANKKPIESATSLEVNDSPGKAEATIGLREWLQAKPAPLPGGTLIGWDGFSEKNAPPLPPDAQQGATRQTYVEEVHRFTVSGATGVYDAYVLVHADKVNGSKVVGTPTLLPKPDLSSVSWPDEIPWFGFEAPPSTVDITQTVNEWAAAFTSGSPAKLKQAVADKSTTSAYVPLTGVKNVKVSVIDTGVEKQDDKEAPPPTWMLARIELSIEWEKQPAVKPGETLSTTSYDLVIDGIDGATPKVVSWGGAGTGGSLKPYSVALQDVALAEPDEKQSLADEDMSEPTTDSKKKSK